MKPPCITVATSNITLSGLQTISSVTVVEGDRVLVKGQTTASENGIYNASTGSWTRALDFDGDLDAVSGTRVLVRSPSSSIAVEYELTTADPIVIGTTSLTFTLRYGANVTYDQTEAEIAEGVTPADYAYPAGDFRRYGAVDGGVVDNAIAWSNMLKQAEGTGGAPARIPQGTWLVNTGYVLNTLPVAIRGDGLQTSIITTTADITVLTLNFNASHSDIRDFTITGPGTTPSDNPGIKCNNSNGNTFKRIKVHAFKYGVYFEKGINSCYLNSMYDCQIISNELVNIYCEGDTNALYLSNCTFGGGPCQSGLYMVNSNNLTVEGGDAEGLTLCVFDLDATATLQAAHYIDGFHFEGNTSSAGDIRIGNTAVVHGVTIVGSLFAPGVGNDSAVNAIRGDGLSILGGDLHSGYSGSGISQGMLRIGASFGTYVLKGVGNVKSTDAINFKPRTSETYLAPTAFDASHTDSAHFNEYNINSGSVAASSYYAGFDVLRVNSSGGAATAGNKMYARAAQVSNAVGSSANARALGAIGGAFDQTSIDVTYSASMTIDAANGNLFNIVVTDGVAFGINSPANPVAGQVITVTISNTSGGAAGAATWNAVFKLAAWTNPATGNSRSISFKYNGTNWIEINRTAADVPN